ncbi:hypothetical protein [Peribacillus simplex]|uniref:Uncharacterized protein n=1 Tax=Peribacillus simplex TaxID=1478 RepID=A0AAW7I3Y8_9BACI|nr:hypothetical protein [Peribacillus simplex]MDM5450685.1 hypothetical protein [Peribacillus simplex]
MTKTNLDTILKGLSEPINETSSKYDNEAMATFLRERNNQIVFPPYSLHKFKNDKTEE